MTALTSSVSVIILCYNYADYLHEAIASVLEQTHPVDEVLVVDDGSTDGSYQVASSFGPRVRALRKTNGGLASARNHGARAATSDLLVFLDADDRLAPRYVETCMNAYAAAQGRRFVYTQWQEFGASDGVSSFPPFDVERMKSGNVVHASALLPREAVLRRPYAEHIRIGWEDWDFYLALIEDGYTGVLVDEPLLLYRQHPGSMLGQWHRKRIRARLVHLLILWRHRSLYELPDLLSRSRVIVVEILQVLLRRRDN